MSTGIGGLLEGGATCVLCPNETLPHLVLYVRYSSGSNRAWLLEHGVYEMGYGLGTQAIAWYLFVVSSAQRLLVLT